MEGNLISGNDGHGIEVSHSPTTVGNQIVGNRIGTDPTGNSGPAYAQNGIRYGHEEVHTEDHVTGTIIAYNIIGNTTLGGIKIDSFSAGTQIHDNKIGVSANGTSIPNGPYGIQIEEGSHDTVVGPNNIIANNRVGIRIQDGTTDLCQVSGGCPAVNNTITQNSIYNNDRLGIDIAPLDVINDASVTSPNNNNAHFPVLSAATSTSVTGTTCASCKVELFVADGTTTDPSLESSYGEGKTFLASGNADGSGNFSLAIAASSTSRLVTSTATDSTGNTSEFSRNIVVPASTDLVNDSFTRTVASGWGTADVGGAYTPQTDPANFAVNGTQGTISVPASTDQVIDLLGTSAKDVDLRATVNTDHLPADGNHIVSLVARRQDATVSYRVGLRFDSSGSVFARVESGATLLGEGLLGLTNDGSPIRLRAQVTGANPTTIKLRAWSAAATEPSTWAVTVTDGTVGPQISGTTGVRASSTSTTGPVLVTVDNFSVSPVPAPK